MARRTKEQLEEIVDRLEQQNAELTAKLSEAAPASKFGRRRLWTWTLLSTVLITIGAILMPVAVVANWTQIQLASTDDFVGTFAPLATKPEVQKFISEQAATVIVNEVDIAGITADLFSGLAETGLPPRAAAALGSLQGAAVLGAQSLIERTVNDFVSSDAFAAVFEGALRVTHSQLTAALRGDPDGALTITRGEIGIQLGPIVASVKQLLIDRGLTFAAAIPAIDRTIVILQSDNLAFAQQAYVATLAIGTWLPWIALAFLLVGVLVARRRRIALMWASAAVALLMIVTIVGLNIGRIVVAAQLSQGLLPESVSHIIFDQLTDYTRNSAIAVAFVAIVTGIVAWFSGESGLPLRLRSAGAGLATSIRGAAERAGLTTGSFGSRLYSARLVIRMLVALAAAAVVIFVRPLTVEVLVTTAILGLVALAISELLQRPVGIVDAVIED